MADKLIGKVGFGKEEQEVKMDREDIISKEETMFQVDGNGNAIPEKFPIYIYDRDLDDIIVYFNGIEMFRYEDFTAKGGVVTLPSRYIDLGALYDETDQHVFNFTGTLDEIAVFNTALTFCEVNAIFNVPATVPCNVGCDAAAYYPFNGNADDESGTNNDGNPPPGYDGTVIGATLAEDQCGFADQAFYFDGGDYVKLTTFNPKTEIGDLQPFTVAFWAKPDRTDMFQSVVGSYDSGPPAELFYIAIFYNISG